MKLVYVHENGKEEVLVEFLTNRTISVENILDLTKFDLEAWSEGEDYDYNALKVRA